MCDSGSSNKGFEHELLTTRVAESTRYTNGTYNPIMPKKLLTLMSINTGSLSSVRSIIAANVDLNDSGRDKQGQTSAVTHTTLTAWMY
jgi:hypothetical protein